MKRRLPRAVCVLAAVCVATPAMWAMKPVSHGLVPLKQQNARNHSAADGVRTEPWWKNAVIYEVYPRTSDFFVGTVVTMPISSP